MDEKCPHGIHTDMLCEPCEVEASQDAETCHALAVLGARVLVMLNTESIVTEINRGEVADYAHDLVTINYDEEWGEERYHYATTQIAATVARLTEGDGNG